MKASNQTGFSAVEAGIIVVVVAVLGLGGWLLWRAKHHPKPTTQQATSVAPSEAASNSPATQSTTKYLLIPEWGVKFALTADTADAYYDAKTSSTLESRSLRSHSLDSQPDCATGSQSVATIFKVPKDANNEDGQPDKMYRDTQQGVVVGDYFYFIAGAQYACTDDPAMAIVLQGVRNGFINASPTIQPL